MTTNLLDGIEEILLMGPGPSCIHPKVYDAISRSTLGHLDPHFVRIMDDIQIQLQKIMNTQNRLTLPLSGTGSAGMESCFVNLVEPADKVLVLINGVFGKRMGSGASPEIVAEQFFSEHAGVFGVDMEDLKEGSDLGKVER